MKMVRIFTCGLVLGLFLGLLGLSTGLNRARPVHAVPVEWHYNQDFTAYAMGNSSSAYGPIVVGEDAAIRCSHIWLPQYGYYGTIPYGTPLVVQSMDIPLPTSNGGTVNERGFVVGDCGNGGSFSSWWVDFYFGRWKFSGDSCYCRPGNNVCTDAQVNSCTRANNCAHIVVITPWFVCIEGT